MAATAWTAPFSGPAIVTGRLAGRTIAGAVGSENGVQATEPQPREAAFNPIATAADLQPLLATPRQGYCHFEVSHMTVIERKYSCSLCHTAELPFAPVVTRAQRNAQTQVCINCHDR
jgi:hypothetical protein